MSAEETELSFVRCARCRSLVPAIATRCRMCGYVFAEAGKNPTNENTADDQSRVRQRTVSVEADDIPATSAEKPVEQSAPAREPVAGRQAGVRESWSIENDQENEEGQGRDMSLVRKAWEASQPPVQQETEYGGTREVREADDEWDDGADEEFDSDEGGEEDEQGDNSMSSAGPSVEGIGEDTPSRKRRRRRRRKRKGQSPMQVNQGHASQGQAPTQFGNQEQLAPRTQQPLQTHQPVNRISEPRRETMSSQPQATHHVHQPVQTQQSAPAQHSRQPNAENAQLVGWFVDFSRRGNGVAHEIRAGQFFVARTRLRPTDLVLEHDSVSVPQCLIQANDGRGLIVQDLMSERGTFVRRNGENSYVQCFEPVVVTHGDWVRFGSYELLVCTIPTKS